MRTSTFLGTWFGLAAGVVVVGSARPATAAECAADSDCPKGFTCEVSEVIACADVPPCEPGAECEAPPECTTEEYRSCESVDCTQDSDCAEGMACETIRHERCSTPSAPASDPGMEPAPGADPLPPDSESSCEVEERNYCVPRYMLPCEAAADCGPGFTCEASEICSCSTEPSSGSSTTGGSAGMPDGEDSDSGAGDDASDAERPQAPPEDGGTDDAAEEPSCVCEPGPVACQLIITECAVNADCPSGMSCEDNPEGSCTSSPDGTEECTADPEKICLPPYVDVYRGVSVSEDSSSSLPGGGPASHPEEPGESDEDGKADGDVSSSGGGCSVGNRGAPMSTWASLGLMLGAALLGRRRRR